MDDALDLDVAFTEVGVTVVGVASEDCTGDGCGGTDESAGVTC
jgi:hypothetical protein